MTNLVRALLGTVACSVLAATSGCSGRVPSAFPGTGSSRVTALVAAHSLSFADWCTNWGLKCDTAPDAPLPAGVKPLTAAQWQSLLTVVRSVGDSATALQLGVDDLDSPLLAKAAGALGEDAVWQAFHARLRGAGVNNLKLGGGVIILASDSATKHVSASGLVVSNDKEVKLSVTADATIAVSGLALGGTHGENAGLTGQSFQDGSKITLSSPELTVTDVPATFYVKQLLDLPTVKTPKVGASTGYAAVQPLVAPLGDLLARDTTTIDIGQAQIDTLNAKLSDLLGDSKIAPALKSILAKVTAVQSTPQSRSQGLLTITATDDITCNIGTVAQLKLAAQSGLGSITRVDDTTTALQFVGLKVATGGVINIPVDISEIDLKPTSIVLRNLPIIGDYTIDLSKDPPAGGGSGSGSGQTPDITCN